MAYRVPFVILARLLEPWLAAAVGYFLFLQSKLNVCVCVSGRSFKFFFFYIAFGHSRCWPPGSFAAVATFGFPDE